VIDYQYYSVSPFSNGKAGVVKSEGDEIIYIDKTGNVVDPT